LKPTEPRKRAWVEHIFDAFSWPRFAATQLWIFVLFLLYVTASHLNDLVGDGELYKIFFKRPSTDFLLTRLARLTEAHPIEVLSVRGSQPHAELVTILHDLAQRSGPRRS